jgi:hypothetical protein
MIAPSARAQPAQLALYAGCGDLVLSLPIEEVVQVMLAEGVGYSVLDAKLRLGTVLFDSLPIAALDLSHLLGQRKPSSARVWIIATTYLAEGVRRFALSCDRSLAVRPQQLDLPLPPRLFASRPGAVLGAFETTSIREAAEVAPTGFALTAAHLLLTDELAAIRAAAGQGKVSW